MVNFKNVISLSLVISALLSTSQAEAGKRKWDEAFSYQETNTSSINLMEIDISEEDIMLAQQYFGQEDMNFGSVTPSCQNSQQGQDDNSNRHNRLLNEFLF